MKSVVDSAARQPWYQFVGELDWLLNSCDFCWAVGTLTAIRETIICTRRVTDGQRHALDSIRERVGVA